MIELTDSIPDRIVNTSFLPSEHSLVKSLGEMRLILTKHGRMGRISFCEHVDNSPMSTFWIAVNTRGDTVVFICITEITTLHRGIEIQYVNSPLHVGKILSLTTTTTTDNSTVKSSC